MANIIIKDADRQEREKQILRDFGHDPKTANAAAREQAEHIAEKCYEAMQKGRRYIFGVRLYEELYRCGIRLC